MFALTIKIKEPYEKQSSKSLEKAAWEVLMRAHRTFPEAERWAASVKALISTRSDADGNPIWETEEKHRMVTSFRPTWPRMAKELISAVRNYGTGERIKHVTMHWYRIWVREITVHGAGPKWTKAQQAAFEGRAP